MMTNVGIGLLLDQEEKERRLAICDQCTELLIKKIPLTQKTIKCCGVCSCILETLVYTRCPLAKWLKSHQPNF